MFRSTLAALALTALPLTAQGQVPQGSADLTALTRVSNRSLVQVHVTGASGPMFAAFASLDPTFRGRTLRLGAGALDATGAGQCQLPIPHPDSLPPNLKLHVRAVYMDGGSMVATPVSTVLLHAVPSERIDFTFHPDGKRIGAGETIAEQWSALGVHVVVDTHHPTATAAGIALDSLAPGADERDLVTPGRGAGNGKALDNLLVVAADMVDADADGAVDAPRAEELGGVVEFRFDQPTWLDRLTLVDVDAPGGRLRCFMGPNLVADLPVDAVGDNSVQTIGFALEPVTRLRVNLAGAVGIAELRWLPCPEEVDFDHTMTGIPLGLPTGAVLGDQLRAENGVRMRFDTHHPTNASKGVLVARGDSLTDPGGFPLGERRVVAVAADTADADGDGLLDAPDAEPLGGVVQLDFDFDVRWKSARVADVDDGEVSWFTAFDANGTKLGTWPLLDLGNDVVQTLLPGGTDGIGGVRRVRLSLGGSGYLVGVEYCAEDQRLTNNP